MLKNPTSLYIHFPWCERKCPYCDFNSHAVNGDIPEVAYLTALLADLDMDLQRFPLNENFHTVFMGGGTPSLMHPNTIAELLNTLTQRGLITSNTEITMEANPGTVEANKLIGFRQAGVNRLSLGIQSFNDTHLKTLGRIHNAHEAEHAFHAARKAQFNNINLDLMYGLPNQTVTEGLDDLKKAINLQPEHISWYQLTLEPNTYFYRYPPTLPQDDVIIELEQQGHALLAAHGYERYEISAYAKKEKQCQHNLNYWQFGDYFGIGAGAHGKLTQRSNTISTQPIRLMKTRMPNTYLASLNNKKFIANEETVTADTLCSDYMLNILRLPLTHTWRDFESRTGLEWRSLQPALDKASSFGLMEYNDTYFKCTPKGLQFLNELLVMFM